MKIKYYFYLAYFVVFIFSACKNDDVLIDVKNSNKLEVFEKNEYNSDLKNFAKVLSRALTESQDLRKMVKSEVRNKFDGDYDVLVKTIMNKTIATGPQLSPSTGLKSNSIVTVKDLLSTYYRSSPNVSGIKKISSSASNVIDELTLKYPKLQISVPVNADKWDVTTDLDPTVTFIPSDYEDGVTKTVTGYKADGSIVQIDAIVPPSDEAIVVIGENERLPIDGEIVPMSPTNLSAGSTESGIRLLWSIPSTSGIKGYRVFRKSASDDQFILQASIYGVNNKAFDDRNVIANRIYSYYVVSFNYENESESSNIVTFTAPANPKSVLSFDAIQHDLNTIELRWDNDYSQYVKATNVYKYVQGKDLDYQLLGQFSSNDHYSFDRNISPGTTIIYKINHVTDLGVSNAKYDFVQTPYRDISQPSPVYIKKLSYTCGVGELEGWLKGAPEFEITVFGVNPDKKTYEICKLSTLRFHDRGTTEQSFSGRKVFDWKPGVWSDMITFHVVEEDNNNFKGIDITAKINVKDTIAKKLNVEAGIGTSFQITDNNEICGDGWLNYFDNPSKWIELQNYGFKIYVSDSDN